MKIQKSIVFTGKNLNDVFGLECVKAIMKPDINDVLPVLVCYRGMMCGLNNLAYTGDTLIQYTDGSWEIVKSPHI